MPVRFDFRVFSGRKQFVLDVIGSRPITFLDVGNLGDGESTCQDTKQLVEKNGGTYVGLDSNAALTAKLNLPNQKVGDMHNAPFEDGTFDAVYLGEVIEHTWTPARMIGECRRILKNGGQLIIDTPNVYAMMSIVRFLVRRWDWMGDDRYLTYREAASALGDLAKQGEVLLQPQHKIFYTPAMLKQLLETQGFIVEWYGTTHKPISWWHRVLLWIFPQCGRHLCCVARKTTIDEAFADVQQDPRASHVIA